MNLDEIKKLSEIFNNIAQPMATLVSAYIGYKFTKRTNKKKSSKKGRR